MQIVASLMCLNVRCFVSSVLPSEAGRLVRSSQPMLSSLLLSLAGAGATPFDASTPRPPIEPALLAPGTATAAFVSRTLGDHMVLQAAPQSAVVWGATTPSAVVTTTFDGQSYEATANTNGTWRQRLPPTAASTKPFTLSMRSTSGENATLSDVVFGEVFVCGGQSNMEFAVPALTNSTDEAQLANAYPHIRIFSVGHATSSQVPLLDLQTVWEPWQVASNLTIRKDFSPGHTLFSTFSAVCWLFGREIADALAQRAGAAVPVGLVSNNWGGTKVEVWAPPSAYAACGRAVAVAPMYNAMIVPYQVGPMALAGFAWYQGEANVVDPGAEAAAEAYGCLFPAMIDAWRVGFNRSGSGAAVATTADAATADAATAAPTATAAAPAYFGFVQLSTWCTAGPSNQSIALMRDAQLKALALPNVGYATNADHGFGCDIHPRAKQWVGKRLARSALNLQYGFDDVIWASPTFASATAPRVEPGATVATAHVQLDGVSAQGLTTDVSPYNYDLASQVPALAPPPTRLNCSAQRAGVCAWAALHLSALGWLNATVAVAPGGRSLLLEAPLPAAPTPAGLVLATAYGWGDVPLLSAYDKQSGLPVLPWNRTVPPPPPLVEAA